MHEDIASGQTCTKKASVVGLGAQGARVGPRVGPVDAACVSGAPEATVATREREISIAPVAKCRCRRTRTVTAKQSASGNGQVPPIGHLANQSARQIVANRTVRHRVSIASRDDASTPLSSWSISPLAKTKPSTDMGHERMLANL